MNDAVRIEKVGEQPDDSGGVVHAHDVFEGSNKIGSFHALVSPQGKVGFKLKGMKMKHMTPILDYMKSNYEVKKAMAADGMTAQPDTQVPQVELNHDRRRIKLAAMALLGQKETPHTPDGKVNKSLAELDRDWLAKAVAAQQLIDAFRPELDNMAREISGKSSFTPHHDHATWLMTHAHHQLNMADKHLNRPKPSVLDRVRSGLGMEPAHQKHLKAAQGYLRAASWLVHRGDTALSEQDPSFPKPQAQPGNITKDEFKLASRAVKGRERLIEGSAKRLQTLWSQMSAANAGHGSQAKAPAAPQKRVATP